MPGWPGWLDCLAWLGWLGWIGWNGWPNSHTLDALKRSADLSTQLLGISRFLFQKINFFPKQGLQTQRCFL